MELDQELPATKIVLHEVLPPHPPRPTPGRPWGAAKEVVLSLRITKYLRPRALHLRTGRVAKKFPLAMSLRHFALDRPFSLTIRCHV